MKLEDLIKKPPQKVEKIPEVEVSNEVELGIQRLMNDVENVGYPSLEFQASIYDWVLEYIPINSNLNFVDIGAGKGDFYNHYLQTRNANSYVGYDNAVGLVMAGNRLYSSIPGFSLANIDYFNSTNEADCTLCIGSLNSPIENKWDYLKQVIRKAKSESNSLILVLNRDYEEGLEYYPINELFLTQAELTMSPFILDSSRFDGIYLLKLHFNHA